MTDNANTKMGESLPAAENVAEPEQLVLVELFSAARAIITLNRALRQRGYNEWRTTDRGARDHRSPSFRACRHPDRSRRPRLLLLA